MLAIFYSFIKNIYIIFYTTINLLKKKMKKKRKRGSKSSYSLQEKTRNEES